MHGAARHRKIGRLVYNSRYGPVAVPSEYKIHEGSIVFRTYRTTFTEEDLRTGIAYAEYKVAFEVDQTDPEARMGWVVLVQGAAHHIDTEAERAAVADLGLESWVKANPSTSSGSIPAKSVANVSARHDASACGQQPTRLVAGLTTALPVRPPSLAGCRADTWETRPASRGRDLRIGSVCGRRAGGSRGSRPWVVRPVR